MSLQVRDKSNIFEKDKPDLGRSGLWCGLGKTEVVCDNSIIPSPPNLDKGLSVNFSNFITLSRDLSSHPSYISSPPAYRIVLLEILFRACWEPTSLDHRGLVFQIDTAQLWVSVRQLAIWCGKGIDKNIVERAISRFCLVGFVRQEVRHSKMLITVTMPELWRNKKEMCETESETKVRQMRDTKEEYKNIRNKNGSKDPIARTTPLPRSNDPLNFSCELWEFVGITDSDRLSWKEAYPCVTLSQEIAAATEWLKSNRSKAKSKKKWRAFLTSWLKNSNEKAVNRAAFSSNYQKEKIDRSQKNPDGSVINTQYSKVF